MRKYTLIIFLSLLLLCFIILFKLFFHEDNDLKSVLSTKEFSKFEDFIKEETDNKNLSGYWEYFRDITYEFKEGIFVFDKYIKDQNGRKTSSYEVFEVKLIVSDDEIIYYELNTEKNKKVKYEWLDDYSWEPYKVLIEKFKNQKKFNNLKTSFKKIYQSELIEKELFVTNYVYGKNCGIAGINPNERDKLNNFVNKKDKLSILKWLKSANTERQIYAVEGMQSLKKSGIKVNQTELKIIKYIRNKKGTIKVCNGCVYSCSEISKIIKHSKL